jgi:N-acetylglucosamine-6-phosphate deacetylase
VSTRTCVTGADLVLSDQVLSGHTLIIEGGRITDIVTKAPAASAVDRVLDRRGHVIVPGFVDVHVHGVDGLDVLDGPGAIRAMAVILPRFGVTAFCPTTIACAPGALTAVLQEVAELRGVPKGDGARVLPAHLESNFISPDYRGAQPLSCLRMPPPRLVTLRDAEGSSRTDAAAGLEFTADDVLAVIDRHVQHVGIVTLAPELDGGLDLVRSLSGAGIRVSLGHTGAGFDVAQAAIAAGASQATHLFNRMPPMTHRNPGVVGAILVADDVDAELICDGHHVHPATMRMAIAAKRRIMAVTDGTAGSGRPKGARVTLGGQPIEVGDVARLSDGTMAGSVLTMDGAFRMLVSGLGLSLVDGARMCATAPARAIGVEGHALARDAVADFVVLSDTLQVVETWIGGRSVFGRQPS